MFGSWRGGKGGVGLDYEETRRSKDTNGGKGAKTGKGRRDIFGGVSRERALIVWCSRAKAIKSSVCLWKPRLVRYYLQGWSRGIGRRLGRKGGPMSLRSSV